jgi:ribosome biogenesis GTPase A
MLLDEHVNVALESKEIKLQRHLEDYRDKMLGLNAYGFPNPGFWLDDDDDDSPNPGAIRVLVCGNTGVGKSTLINKTFGVDVVSSYGAIESTKCKANDFDRRKVQTE